MLSVSTDLLKSFVTLA